MAGPYKKIERPRARGTAMAKRFKNRPPPPAITPVSRANLFELGWFNLYENPGRVYFQWVMRSPLCVKDEGLVWY